MKKLLIAFAMVGSWSSPAVYSPAHAGAKWVCIWIIDPYTGGRQLSCQFIEDDEPGFPKLPTPV